MNAITTTVAACAGEGGVPWWLIIFALVVLASAFALAVLAGGANHPACQAPETEGQSDDGTRAIDAAMTAMMDEDARQCGNLLRHETSIHHVGWLAGYHRGLRAGREAGR